MKLKKLGVDALGAMTGIIGPIIGLITALFKHKQFCLWYRGPDRQPYLLIDFAIFREAVNPGPGWIKKSNPMSARQCEKTKHDLWVLGPNGVNP
ncbi:MAG: hypothetical protein IMZ62_15860 [Chloroflexi bacterium]|nr:hypothetical protein [Chloroflexota bacterium]